MKALRVCFGLAVTFEFVVLAVLASSAHADAVCGRTCAPDPTSPGYGNTLAAMTSAPNLRGGKSVYHSVAAASHVNAAGFKVATQAGSQSYSYAVPVLSLPGRAGLDLNLTLHYNSRIWDVDSATNTVTFNPDRDSPSYGFRLDFGFLEFDSTHSKYILVEGDGTKRQLTASGSNYVSTDSSFIQYTPVSLTLYYKNGTRVFYQVFPTQATLYQPIKIEDTNGNYITITYRTDTWATGGLEIDTITDTVGRAITFGYDPTSHSLTSVFQGTTTYLQLFWNTSYTFNYAFTGLTVQNSPTSGSTLPAVLDHCTLGNGTGYYFTYGDWALINRIDFKSSSGSLRSYVSYNFPLASTALSDAPTYTTQTVFDGVNAPSWQYAVSKTGHVVNWMTVTDVYGTVTKTSLGSSLVSSITIAPSGGSALRTSTNTWSSGNNPTLSNVVTTLNDSGEQFKNSVSLRRQRKCEGSSGIRLRSGL